MFFEKDSASSDLYKQKKFINLSQKYKNKDIYFEAYE